MKITSKLLREWAACRDQVKIFEELWPNGVYPSPEFMAIAQAHGFRWRWLARFLMNDTWHDWWDWWAVYDGPVNDQTRESVVQIERAQLAYLLREEPRPRP
jgi:hypothetical protein